MVRFGVGVLSDEVLVHNDVKVQLRSLHCQQWPPRRWAQLALPFKWPRAVPIEQEIFGDQCDLHVWRVIH